MTREASATSPQLGDYFVQRQEPGRAGLPTLSVTLNDGLVLRSQLDRRTESALEPESHLLVRAGDLVYNTMRMWQGACGVADRDGLVSPAYVVMVPRAGIDGRFAYHWFKTDRMLYLLWAYSHGITDDRLRLYADDFASIPVVPPSLGRQRTWAAALDHCDQEIGRTERLVEAKRKRFRGLLAVYRAEQQDNRVEFGDLVSLVSVKAQPGASGAQETSVELEDIESGTGRLIGRQVVTADSAIRNRFVAGDTLFGKLRPYLGKFSRPDFDGLCSTEIWVLRARPGRLSPDLLPFLVQTPEFMAAATKQSGSRMPRADWEVVSAAPVPCPSTPELQSRAAERLRLAWRAANADLDKLDRLRLQKRGLMQKLLSGEHQLGADTAGVAA